jgi:hypothetical protein
MNFWEKQRILYLEKFKIKFPEYKIIEFTNIGSKIKVIDENGIVYSKNAIPALKGNFTFSSIVDKFNYISLKIKELFPNLELIEFHGTKEKLIVKDENEFTYSPQTYDLLKGHPVSIQTCNEKEELFRFKANLKHNKQYEYSDFKYINGKQKINISCSIHGNFKQQIESHLSGNGCPKCNIKGGFNKQSWLNKTSNKNCIFYILEFYNNDELFIKVGITSVGIKSRYRRMKNYEYNILYEICKDCEEVFDLEKLIIKKYKENKYMPKLKLEGKSECFNINIKNELLNEVLPN